MPSHEAPPHVGVALSAEAPGLPAEGRSRPLRRDAVANRELVVRAALEVFSEFGTLGTVDQVAERAGVGRATVYRSFPTREALMTAIGISQLAELAEMARESLARAARADRPELGLVDYVYRLFAYNRVNRLYLELFRGELTPAVFRARDTTRAALAALLNAARSGGLLRADVMDDDFQLLTSGVAVQLSLDPDSTSERWLRAPGLVLMALGIPPELAVRNPSA
ncbi:MAG: TetR/AcrR family transcriptional regulator [Pseudonocardiales bacterium]|nr:TetR/AcrR family transcriptional regulator [Pseudonocardiales bacterium]